MTDTYKILGQSLTGELALDNSTVKETIAYEVPAGTKASVSAIAITNSDIADQTYRVAFVPSTDVDAAVSNIPYTSGSVTEILVGASTNNSYSMYTLDGITWGTNPMAQALEYNDIEYGNNMFVMVATGSISYYSTDGATWTATSMPVNASWNNVAYGNGIFLAISQTNNFAATSTDGINWISLAGLPTSDQSQSLVYAQNKFFIGQKGQISSFDNNGNWTTVSLPGPFYPVQQLSYGNGIYVAYKYGGVCYSTDGVSWNSSPASINVNSPYLIYASGKFVLIGWNFDINSSLSLGYYSTDGLNWTTFITPAIFASLFYFNNKFIMTTYNNSYYSSDLITWTVGTNSTFMKPSSAVVGQIDTTQTFTQEIPQSLNKHVAIYNKTIAAGETHEIKGGVTLSAGDQIRVYSDSAEIITNVYGVEIA